MWRYYKYNDQVDRHNRYRSEVGLEKAFFVKEWTFRINLSLLAMIVVDTYLLYLKTRPANMNPKNVHDCSSFTELLAGELIDNNYDGKNLRSKKRSASSAHFVDLTKPHPKEGITTYDPMEKRKAFKKNKITGVKEEYLESNRRVCCVKGCSRKSKYKCTECHRYVCDNIAKGKTIRCITQHIEEKHL